MWPFELAFTKSTITRQLATFPDRVFRRAVAFADKVLKLQLRTRRTVREYAYRLRTGRALSGGRNGRCRLSLLALLSLLIAKYDRFVDSTEC